MWYCTYHSLPYCMLYSMHYCIIHSVYHTVCNTIYHMVYPTSIIMLSYVVFISFEWEITVKVFSVPVFVLRPEFIFKKSLKSNYHLNKNFQLSLLSWSQSRHLIGSLALMFWKRAFDDFIIVDTVFAVTFNVDRYMLE